MTKRFSKIKNKKCFYFAIILVLYEMLYWIITFFTGASFLGAYFLPENSNDTSMDYFNMLANMQYDTPYANYSNYPAICFLFWKILYGLMPKVNGTVDGYFLRTYMPAQLGYIILTTLTIIILWELFQSFPIGGKIERKLLSLGILMSGPMLFTFERGNIIILALLFSLVFIRLYNSNQKRLRIIAYISLVLSASIKLYPALFGLLVLQKKRYKEASFLLLMGILFFIVPFFAFEGIQSLKDMLHGMFLATSDQMIRGLGYNYSFNNLINIVARIIKISITSVPIYLRIFPVLYCILLYFLTSKHWQKIFVLILLFTWAPEISYQYLLIFFAIPFMFYLMEEKENDSYFNCLYGCLFIVILIPIALPVIDKIGTYQFPLSIPGIIINFTLLLFSLMILLESLRKGGVKYASDKKL